ncbi:MAG: hypothetical protein LJF04_12625 [Gemmatimonadetes bacterium]|nr:hypothetical protein [Gemmatimonadota bacterium]
MRPFPRAVFTTLGVSLLVVTATIPATAQVDPGLFRNLEARSIGPTGMSGRVGAIDALDADPDILYVGAATGGLWKSVDGGVTWKPLTDSLPAASIGAIAVYQPNPDVVWIGTGERNRRNSAGVGTGVYRSLDGGKTWASMGLPNTGAIDAVLMDPRNAAVVYVGALGNTWKDSEDRGVYKSTDGGKTWKKILYVNPRTGAGDMVMDPSNPNHLIVGMWEHRRWPWFFKSGGPGSGIYTTYDGGQTWKRLTPADGIPEGELGRTGLDFSRGRPDVVYALVEATRSVVLRSTDGGDSWTVVNRTRNIDGRPFYYGQIRVDPTNENHVWIVESPVNESTDGGKTFQTLLGFDEVHVDHHAFWVGPHGKVILDGNDGGVYISRNGGGTFRHVQNLPFSQFYHIAVDNDTPYHVYGGLQDNGSFVGPALTWHNGGIRMYDWEEVAFGDGMATFPDPSDSRYGYSSTQNGDILRFDRVTGERRVIKPAAPDTATELRFNWNAGMTFDPFDGSIYLGSQFVHRSTDHGNSWTTISPDLTTNDSTHQTYHRSGGLTYDVSGAEFYTTIIQIAPSPVKQGLIWVGTDDGNVQLTRDAGKTWTNVVGNIKGVPAGTWVPHIEPSKFDSATAFVVFDDHRRGNNQPYVFKTTDFGRSWTSLVTPDLQYFMHTIAQDPVSPNLLFLGSEFGMYVSLDGGGRWALWRGLPRAPVRGILVHPRDKDLVVGTHGRGAWILDDVRPLETIASDPGVTKQHLHLFSIPPAVEYVEGQVNGPRFTGFAMFQGENRPYGALLTYLVGGESGESGMARDSSAASTDTTATISVLQGDRIIRTFRGPAKPGLNRTAWNLAMDGFRSPRAAGQKDPEILPSGPSVLPGTYTVRVAAAGDTVTGTVTVSPDPRIKVSTADRQANLEAMLRAGQRQDVATEAVDRLRDTRQSVDEVSKLLADRNDEASKALKAAGDSLKQKLTKVEELFTGEEDVQGFADAPNAVMSRIGGVMYDLSSSWDAPTKNATMMMQQAEELLQTALARYNQVVNEDVAAYRRRLEAAQVQVFTAPATLTREWRGTR